MAAAPHDHDDAATELDYSIGTMEISEQRKTFDVFIGLMKWGSLVIAALLVLTVLWTSTGAGPLGSIIATIGLVVLGVLLLRGKNDGQTH